MFRQSSSMAISNDEANADQDRLQQILNVDTRAMLTSLNNLELKLLQFNRQDEIPSWAAAIIPRLDRLEANLRSVTMAPSSNAADFTSVPGGATRDDMSREDRLMARMKKELETQSETFQLSLESKAAMTSAELERMHKLLSIRPTTSEFQKVMIVVTEMESRLKYELGDITKGMLDVVHQSIAKELESLSQGVKSTGSIADRTVDNITKRLDVLGKDVFEMKSGVNADIALLHAEIQENKSGIIELRHQLARAESQHKEDTETLTAQLSVQADLTTQLQHSLELTEERTKDAIKKMELNFKNEIRESYHEMKRIGDRSDFQVRDVKQLADSLQRQLDEHKKHFLQTAGELAENVAGLNDYAEKNKERVDNMMTTLSHLQRVDYGPVINEIQGQLQSNKEQFGVIDLALREAASEIAAVNTYANKLKGELSSKTSRTEGRLDELYAAVEDAQRAIEQGVGDTAGLNDSLKEIRESVDDLQSLRSTMDYLKQSNSAQMDTLNAVQERMESLDAMMKYVSDSSQAGERGVMQSMDQLQDKLHEVLMEHQAELEARIEAVQETLEQSIAEGSSMGPGGGGGRATAAGRRGKSSAAAQASAAANQAALLAASNDGSDSDDDDGGSSRRSSRGSSRKDSSAARQLTAERRRSRLPSSSSAASGEEESVPSKYPLEGKHMKDGGGMGKLKRKPSTRGVLLSSSKAPPPSSSTGPAAVAGGGGYGYGPVSTIVDTSDSFIMTPPASRPITAGDGASTPSNILKRAPLNETPTAAAALSSKSSGSKSRGFFQQDEQPPPQLQTGSVPFSSSAGAAVDAAPSSSSSLIRSTSGASKEQERSATALQEGLDGMSVGSLGSASESLSGAAAAAPRHVDRVNIQRAATDGHTTLASSGGSSAGGGRSSSSIVPAAAGQTRQKVSGFSAAGSSGYSNQYKYQPGQSLASLQSVSAVTRPEDDEDGPFEQRAIRLIRENADVVFDLGSHFEAVAVRRSLVPDIDSEAASDLAATALEVAEVVAKLADTEALLRLIRARPDEATYGDDFIANRRLKLMDEMLSDVRHRLHEGNPEAGITRLDARDFFLKRVERALQTALSKHDQVLVPTYSRAGRVKIPSCIACDRPLLEKVRQDMVTRSEIAHRGSIAPFGSMVLESPSQMLSPTGAGAVGFSLQSMGSSVDEGSLFFGEKERDSHLRSVPVKAAALVAGRRSTSSARPEEDGLYSQTLPKDLRTGGGSSRSNNNNSARAPGDQSFDLNGSGAAGFVHPTRR